MPDSQLSPIGRFDKILLATDGTEFSSGAERDAMRLAKQAGAELCVLFVVIANAEAEFSAPGLVAKSEEEARSHLDRLYAVAKENGVEFRSFMRNGDDEYQEMAQLAEEEQVDLLVVRRRSQQDLLSRLLGSSTATLIEHTHSALLVAPRISELQGKRFLVAVDGTRYGDAAALAAGNVARLFGASLTVLNVATEGEQAEAKGQEVVARTAELLRKEGDLVVETLVALEGRPEEKIVMVAKDMEADLIIIGTHARTGLESLFKKSVSEWVVGHAGGAVLVVPV